MKRRHALTASFALLLGTIAWGPDARAADATIKIGYIDPFSGAFAAGGDTSLKQFQFIIDGINAKGGALGKKFEIVTFDDKQQPAEALIALKSITDQNMPIVMSCVSSNVGSALIDAVNKHNTRNPDNRVLQLNCGQLATELTNEQCSFWHFRFAGSVEMRAVARIKSLPASVKTVYMLNQDYLFGQSIRNDSKKYLALYRPDIKIVGDEMIPLMQVKDFSPYITKIKASGAQSLLTGNYGPDLAYLIKAGVDSGLNVRYDTYLGHVIGAPTAIGSAADGRMTSVMEMHENVPVEEHNAAQEEFVKKWRETHDFGFFYISQAAMFDMLVRAINAAGSTDPLKVALQLEGMEQKDMFGAVNIMRKDDHQLLMPYYEAVLTKGEKYDVEKTGLGWKSQFKTTVADETLPTICKMKRPES